MKLVLAFMLVVSTQSDDQVPGDFTSVKLPLLVRRFVTSEATAFAVGPHKGANYLLAALDKENRLRVATSKGKKGKVLSAKLEIPKGANISLLDLDHDGASEILVRSDRLYIFSIQNEKLSLAWTSQESFNPEVAPKVQMGDFNQDGVSDIALLNYKDRNRAGDTKCLYLYLGVKDDLKFRLSGSLTVTDKHGYHSTAELAVGDYVGDKTPDLVVANHNGFLWLVQINNEKPEVITQWKVPRGGAVGGLTTGNLVPGGRPELLAGTNGGEIFVYGFSDEGKPKVVGEAMAGRLAYGVCASDIDGDDIDEFLLTRGQLGYNRMTESDVVAEVWKLQKGELKPVWRKPLLGFKYPALKVHDFDADGVKDLVVYSPYGEGTPIEVICPKLK